jgi:ornithine carbamoyltransferase
MLAMMFDKPSTRTRVSFDVAMRRLGGQTIVLNSGEMQLGRGETIADTARVLSRYVDAIMLRTGAHETLTELAENASIPVINGLTDASHPCQVMADILAFEEHRGPVAGRTIAWIGDGNNVASSWIHAAVRFGFTLRLACPAELSPQKRVLDWAAREGGAVTVTQDPAEAAAGADALVTDVWVSMGDGRSDERRKLLTPYQVNATLMANAAADAVFMHCLPAHRGDEVTAEVIDGPRSIVFDEAENRLHAQRAILAWCLERT